MNVLKMLFPKTARRAFWLSFLACLVAGLFIIFVITRVTGISKGFGGDSHDGYLEIARNFVAGNGFVINPEGPPTFHRPPAYVFTLIPIVLLPPPLQRPALIILQSLMVACIAALMFKTANLLFDKTTAGLSIIILLVNPWVYWNAKNPMTPILQTLLYTLFTFLIGILLLNALNDKLVDQIKHPIALGIAIGITAAALTLTHGAMLPVSCILLFALFILGIVRKNPQPVYNSFVIAFVMLALIAPWTYRNWTTFHRFIPVVRGGAMAYYNGVGHWSCTTEEPQQKGEAFIDASLRIAGFEGTEKTLTHEEGFKDIELDDEMSRRMVEHMRTHPKLFAIKVLLNSIEYYFPLLTSPFLSVKVISLERIALTIFHLALWILAFIGIWKCRRKGQSLRYSLLLLAAIFLYAVWYFPFATFIGHSLYTFGTIPLLSILAARGLAISTDVLTGGRFALH